MSFAHSGISREEYERRERAHAEAMKAITERGGEEVTAALAESRQLAREHNAYREWRCRTGAYGVSFDDWKAGRYVLEDVKVR